MQRVLLGVVALSLMGAEPASDSSKPAEAEAAPSMDRVLTNPKGYAAKVIGNCSALGKDLITRDGGVQRTWTFTRYDNGGLLHNWSVDVGPPVDPMAYIKSNRPVDVLLAVPTAVHEIGRGYAYRSAFAALQAANIKSEEGHEYRNFYLGPDLSILVELGESFPASQVASAVPEQLRLPRYGILTNADPKSSSEKRGAYGLLDELVAYNLHARAAMDMLLCGWEDSGLTPAMWLDLITGADSALLAREEMGVYLLTYLSVAKEKSPDIYAALLANKPFVRTYLEADRRLAALQSEFEPALEAQLGRIKDRGVSADAKKDKVGVGGTWRGRFTKQQTVTREALATGPLAAIRAELEAASN